MAAFAPFLAAIYFVLTIAAHNAGELQGLGDLVRPLALTLAVSGLAWIVAYGLTRSAQKASLEALLCVVAFSVFGHVAETLMPTGVLRVIGGETGLIALFGLALLGPALAIRRTRRSLASWNRYFTLVTALLVCYTGVLLGLSMARPMPLVAVPAVTLDSSGPGDLPDIYLIILDKYTGGEILREHFLFDNGPFESSLLERGFVVPRAGRANYPQTTLALAALLNFDYVQQLAPQAGPDLPPWGPLYELIETNRLVAFLQARGYRFVFFPTAFSFTAKNRHADLQLPDPSEVRGEFEAAWQQTTMLPELMAAGCVLLRCQAGPMPYVPETAELLDWKFERLTELAGRDRPVFVFAHLALPHEPYLYRGDCTHRIPHWPRGMSDLKDERVSRGYLDQIRCVNRKLIAVVDSIQRRSRRPPVILLQSDHGDGRFGIHLPAFEQVGAYRMRERMSIFAAYMLPGLARGAVSDSITPVNAVRLVLRHYLGADLPPLEDVGYWSSGDRPLVYASRAGPGIAARTTLVREVQGLSAIELHRIPNEPGVR